MRRNWDLIRKLLLEIERHGSCEDATIDARSKPDLRDADAAEAEVRYHYQLLSDSGLARLYVEERSGKHLARLTMRGHDLADAIRDTDDFAEFKVAERQRLKMLTQDLPIWEDA